MSTPLLAVPHSKGVFCPNQGKVVRTVVSGLLGALVGAFGANIGWEATTPLIKEALHQGDAHWLILPGFPLMMLFAVAWDGLGHRVAARVFGFGFCFPTRRSFDLPVYGNLTTSMATDTRDLTRRFACVLVGGPAANLLLSVTLFLASSVPAVASHPVTHLALILLAAASALICAVSVIPMPYGIGLTDGGHIARLLRGGPAAERDVSLLRLAAQIAAGVPPLEWDGRAVNGALQPDDGSVFEWHARQLAYRHALEHGDIGAAGEHLDIAMEMISLVPKSTQAAARLEAAYFEAWHRGRAEFALEWLEGVPVNFAQLPPHEHLRATAAIQSALGEKDAARSAVAEALRQIITEKHVTAWSRARLTEMGNALNR